MRVIGEIPHQDCKITIFSWNNRYLLKFESGHLEQTYKINQFDVTGEHDLLSLVDEAFIQHVLVVFENMGRSFQEALDRA